MVDMLSLFFEVQPDGAFASLPVALIAPTLILIASIIYMVYIRIHSLPKDVRIVAGTIPMHLFYVSLTGYFLVIFRLSNTPVLAGRYMWVLWLAWLIWRIQKDISLYGNATRLAKRKQENKEAGVEVVDPYLTSHFKRKKKR